MAHHTQLLTSLRKSIVDKPPYISGTIRPPDSCFSLFYKETKDGHAARHINFSNATPDELEQLAHACEPASFGMNQEDVLDESYRKAGKMDLKYFTPMLDPIHNDLLKIIRSNLLEGTKSTKNIKTELYKLNVYGKGSFFKPHVDTPRSEKMFGSLVIVFPTPHEGGALLLRHRGKEWTFDSGQALASNREPSIGYAAFFSDIEHEVAPVISGYRITLTYNLYFDDDGLVANDTHLTHPQPENEGAFPEVFKGLLEEPDFLPDGGTLAFGLRHVYPIENDLKHVYDVLKGSDAVVYQTFRELGFEPVLYLYYQDEDYGSDEGMIIDKVVNFQREGDTLQGIMLDECGVPVIDPDSPNASSENRERVEWVTPVTQFNRHKDAFHHYGNDSSLEWAYGDVCLIVRIGGAGERLAYTTVEEVNEGARERRDMEADRLATLCMKMTRHLGQDFLQDFWLKSLR